ncbi:alpha-1,2-fucosyltransferase [Patescibacteria group bacterium]|nr:alpha-1,2-fucosyltransferase [Patescibacteria group bacterium]
MESLGALTLMAAWYHADMIIAKLQGGLGNQMFQYAFGRALAEKYGVPLKLDVTMFPSYKYHSLTIDKLAITAPFATNSEIRRFTIHRRRPNWPWKILNLFLHNPKKYVVEKTSYYYPEVLETQPPCLVDGYWLTEKYFLDIEPLIRNEFAIRGESNDYTRQMEEKIKAAEHPVMLHVRRMDFAHDSTMKKFHGTVSPEYYERSIAYIRERIQNPTFFVFSDDPEWARANIHPGAPTEYIGQGAQWNYLDLYLMTLCEHFILANSTFGWWGAWLSKHYRKNITIMPKYMSIKMDSRDLACPGWVVFDDKSLR